MRTSAKLTNSASDVRNELVSMPPEHPRSRTGEQRPTRAADVVQQRSMSCRLRGTGSGISSGGAVPALRCGLHPNGASMTAVPPPTTARRSIPPTTVVAHFAVSTADLLTHFDAH